MPIKILINGPPGAGKSTIVRRVMSCFTRRVILPGGVGGLPMGYRCANDTGWLDGIDVLGNYENDRRDRHGMCQFDRYPHDFEIAMRHALQSKTSILCEGGFKHWKRLHTDAAQKFCDGCIYVWLSPVDARERAVARRGRELDLDGWVAHRDSLLEVRERMRTMGTTVREFEDRDFALSYVAGMLNIPLEYVNTTSIEENYR